jgi:PDZ domain
MKKLLLLAFILTLLCTQCTNEYMQWSQKIKRTTIEATNFKKEIDAKEYCGIYTTKIKINGKMLNFTLQTEYSRSIITKEAAAMLQLPLSSNIVTAPNISISDIQLSQVPFYIGQTDNILTCCNEPIHGIIGSDIMKNMVWQFDNPNKRVFIASRVDSFAKESRKSTVTLYTNLGEHGCTPLIELRLNKNFLSHAYVFTGLQGNIFMTEEQVAAISDTTKYIAYTTAYVGDSNFTVENNKYMNLKGLTLEQSVSLDSHYISSDPNFNGAYLGNAFFSYYTVTFDWKNNHISLSEKKEDKKENNMTYGLNYAYYKRRKKVLVHTIYKNSPAYLAGVAIGDEILSVNGADLTSMNKEQYHDWATGVYANPLPEKSIFRIKKEGEAEETHLRSVNFNTLWRKKKDK